MAMTYTSLVGPKGSTGSIANWAAYSESKLDLPTILDEAQSLIYQSLRVREMRTEFAFGIPENGSRYSLPSRFLDPIGRLIDTTNNLKYRHYTESTVKDLQSFEQVEGVFANNPFTTGAANSGNVAAVLASNELTQGSDITITGATSPIDGVTVNGTFLITAASTSGFTMKTYDSAIVGGITGGGAAATWTARKLANDQPSCWSIWDEAIQFNAAFDQDVAFRLLCFMSLPLLSAASPTNFLTNRYPLLLRKATQACAADFMQDDIAYQKHLSALGALIEATNGESDLSYRGADLGVETP